MSVTFETLSIYECCYLHVEVGNFSDHYRTQHSQQNTSTTEQRKRTNTIYLELKQISRQELWALLLCYILMCLVRFLKQNKHNVEHVNILNKTQAHIHTEKEATQFA